MAVKNSTKVNRLLAVILLSGGIIQGFNYLFNKDPHNTVISVLDIEAAEAAEIEAKSPYEVDLCGLLNVNCNGETETNLDYGTVTNIIKIKAQEYGIDEKRMLAIASCESGLRPEAVNTQGSSASGLFMFIKATWKGGARKRGLNWNLDDRFDPVKATDMAAWFMSQDGWHNWQCDPIIHEDIYCAIRPNDSNFCYGK